MRSSWAGSLKKILGLLRVPGQMVELIRTVGIAQHQLPLFVPDHPDRPVLVKYDNRTAVFQLWRFQPCGKAVTRELLLCADRAAGQTTKSGQYVVVAEQLAADGPFCKMTGPGGDEGYLHGAVVHVLGEGTVSLAPDAVLPQVHAVVGGEDNDSVVCDSQLIQAVHHAPDLVIHGCDGGVVAPQQLLSSFSSAVRTGENLPGV